MRMEELQDSPVPPLVLGFDLRVLQIASGRHPAVHLIAERLDMVRHLEVLLESLDGLGVLVLRREDRSGYRDLLCVGWVDHRGMALGDRDEGRVGRGGEGEDLKRVGT